MRTRARKLLCRNSCFHVDTFHEFKVFGFFPNNRFEFKRRRRDKYARTLNSHQTRGIRDSLGDRIASEQCQGLRVSAFFAADFSKVGRARWRGVMSDRKNSSNRKRSSEVAAPFDRWKSHPVPAPEPFLKQACLRNPSFSLSLLFSPPIPSRTANRCKSCEQSSRGRVSRFSSRRAKVVSRALPTRRFTLYFLENEISDGKNFIPRSSRSPAIREFYEDPFRPLHEEKRKKRKNIASSPR